MANVLVLNEIDMHSSMGGFNYQDPAFSPTDLISLLRQGDPHLSTDLVSKLFRTNLDVIRRDQSSIGRDLVLRDHSHSHFLTGERVPERPTLLENARRVGAVRSVVTVRNPIHSYASMTLNEWHKDFSPATFDEYCRRYLSFLDAHEDVPRIKYESFVSAPHETMKEICRVLELTYFQGFEDVYGMFRFSGDSGRSRPDKIFAPDDRPISPVLQEQVSQSTHYAALAERLEYQTTIVEL
ncbi:MAG: sulfotransferase [Hyphomonas sp.]|nr:sulfotransferase [Hyphomonas sp.]